MIMSTIDNVKRARLAYVSTRVLDTPFWAIYNMLPLILYKDLHATPLQVTAIVTLKPLVSLLSMYWSAAIYQRPDRLLSNILWARGLGYLPFFFFPFIENVWFFVFAIGLYMMLAVGSVPAWMEVLKLTLPDRQRERVFSYAQAFGYLGGGLLPFAFGFILDGYHQAWRWLFPLASALALLSTLFQHRVQIPEASFITKKFQLSASIYKPWKDAWGLLKRRADFRHFQIGFMLVGCGLMLVAPVLPNFLVDHLHLSYTELAIALTVCKGIGFALASPFWSRFLHSIDFYFLSAIIAALGCLLPVCLTCAEGYLGFLYLGYLCYGIMQSGNELLWNMSGPFFAKNEDSSLYTSVNIVAIGLRGCCIPALGAFLGVHLGSSFVLLSSCLIYFAAVAFLISYRLPLGSKEPSL